MARPKNSYVCGSCGARTSQWQGQCPACEAWNSLELVAAVAGSTARAERRGPAVHSASKTVTEVSQESDARAETGIGELDRVLGGGLVAGSVVLLGGDPGIGKSTLLLQYLGRLAAARKAPVLYCSGE